jgi:hypothetical protein
MRVDILSLFIFFFVFMRSIECVRKEKKEEYKNNYNNANHNVYISNYFISISEFFHHSFMYKLSNQIIC